MSILPFDYHGQEVRFITDESGEPQVIEHRYSSRSDKARYFRPVPNHQAPRFKGEVMHTLKVTPAGAEAISKMAKRWGLVVQEVAA